MHIEPGLLDAGKIGLSYATAAGTVAYVVHQFLGVTKTQGVTSLAARSLLTSLAVFCFFEVLPHHPMGVSELHLILGSTLFLLFGLVPAAVGLALGLLAQGLLVAPWDLPQYGANLTTLVLPLVALDALARRIIPPGTAYVNLTYRQTATLSAAYQAGIVLWVAFWVLYGRGFGADNLQAVMIFASSYAAVVVVEPLIDMALLAAARQLFAQGGRVRGLQQRMFAADAA